MAVPYESLLKLFGEFTWRKFIVVLLLCGVGFFVYERYTSSFRFSRLQRATELLGSLQEIEHRETNASPEWERAKSALLTQAAEAIEERPLSFDFIPSTLKFPTDGVWKFAAGSALWWGFVLFLFSERKSKQGKDQFHGALLIAVLSGLVAVFVPAIWWPWFHILVYPWLLISVIMSVSVPLAILFHAVKRAKATAEEINCVNHLKQLGIAAHQWASEHGGSLPGDSDWIERALEGKEVMACPSTPQKRYRIFQPVPAVSDTTAVYAWCPVHNCVLLADGAVHRHGVQWVKANFDIAQQTAQKNRCINNLRQIDGAIQQWALEHRKTKDSIFSVADIVSYLKNGILPKCPAGGTYTIRAVGVLPACTIHGHLVES